MRKPLLLILIVTIGIGAISALVNYIRMDGLAFAWALNFLLMIFALAFTEAQKSQLTSSYYHEKEWERKGEIYKRLGVNIFRKILVWTTWEKLNKKSNPIEKSTKALMNLHHQTKKSELGHLIVLFIVLGFNVFVAIRFGAVKSLWLLILNVILNLYPIFLQRYNRPRIERVINLSNRR
jgi:hypothetical protein